MYQQERRQSRRHQKCRGFSICSSFTVFGEGKLTYYLYEDSTLNHTADLLHVTNFVAVRLRL